MAEPLAVEQRAHPRVVVDLEVHLSRKVGKEVVAHTCDLSVSGARVTSDRPLRVDEELRFELALPRGAHLGGKARVLRQHRHDTYALRFEHIAASTRGDLDAFVASRRAG
jgi:PilZ domain